MVFLRDDDQFSGQFGFGLVLLCFVLQGRTQQQSCSGGRGADHPQPEFLG